MSDAWGLRASLAVTFTLPLLTSLYPDMVLAELRPFGRINIREGLDPGGSCLSILMLSLVLLLSMECDEAG